MSRALIRLGVLHSVEAEDAAAASGSTVGEQAEEAGAGDTAGEQREEAGTARSAKRRRLDTAVGVGVASACPPPLRTFAPVSAPTLPLQEPQQPPPPPLDKVSVSLPASLERGDPPPTREDLQPLLISGLTAAASVCLDGVQCHEHQHQHQHLERAEEEEGQKEEPVGVGNYGIREQREHDGDEHQVGLDVERTGYASTSRQSGDGDDGEVERVTATLSTEVVEDSQPGKDASGEDEDPACYSQSELLPPSYSYDNGNDVGDYLGAAAEAADTEPRGGDLEGRRSGGGPSGGGGPTPGGSAPSGGPTPGGSTPSLPSPSTAAAAQAAARQPSHPPVSLCSQDVAAAAAMAATHVAAKEVREGDAAEMGRERNDNHDDYLVYGGRLASYGRGGAEAEAGEKQEREGDAAPELSGDSGYCAEVELSLLDQTQSQSQSQPQLTSR